MQENHTIQRLLGAIAEAEVPAGSLDLTEQIRRQARLLPAAERRQRAPRMRLFRPAMAALCLAAIVAIGLQLLPMRASGVSAQEALRRAEQVSVFGLPGVTTLHGVYESLAPATGTVVREEVWVEQPARLRKEIVWPASGKHEADLQTELTLGEQAWIWSHPVSAAGPESISPIAPAELGSALYVIPNPYTSLDPADQPSAGLCAQPGDQLSSLGEETVLGRTTLVIECVIGGDGADSSDAGTRLRFWIDKQLFVVLKYDYYDSTGALFIQSGFTEFELDPAIPAERFALPAGVPIEQ